MKTLTLKAVYASFVIAFALTTLFIALPTYASEWEDPNPTTASFTLYKYVIGDEYPDGEHPAIPDFTFHLDGPISISMKSGETVELPVGTYILTETGPAGFILDFWGGACDEADGTSDSEDAEVVVTESDVTSERGLGCQVYNEIDTENPPVINGTLTVTKVVTNDDGGTGLPDDFFFKVNNGSSVAFEADGTNVLSLPPGTYDVTEVMAPGYTTSYQGCSDIELVSGGNATCTITNNDIEEGTSTPQNGTLTVNKVVVNNNSGTSTASQFSFQVNGSTSIPFEADGTNVLSLPAGIYTVTEVVASGYTTTYEGCTEISLPANGSATCTITNNDIPGGNGTSTVLYTIEGYVWADTDRDGVFDEGESPLPNWVVGIAEEQDITEEDVLFYDITETNEDGYYSFMVPEGTWVIAEEVQDGWEQTFPFEESDGVHVVTVPEEPIMTQTALSNFFALFITTAHAQAPQVFGPFNFGNVFVGGGDNGGGGSSGGGGGGSGKRISLSSSGGGSSNVDEDEPQGEVRGAVAPLGAPNAGMGGGNAGTFGTTLMFIVALLTAIGATRRTA